MNSDKSGASSLKDRDLFALWDSEESGPNLLNQSRIEATPLRTCNSSPAVNLPTPTSGRTPPPSPDQMLFPEELKDHPRYQLVRKIGEGGMGAVFKAEHKLMGRFVALKVMNREMVDDALTVARFKQEVRAAACLAHPNIVLALDAEQVGECHLLVMEYVEGVTLSRHVQANGPMPIGRACEVLQQTALGLSHAHAHGMIHRDIKPQNLMLTPEGQVKILDFGLARFALQKNGADEKTAKGITLQGEVLGTPDYVAPEQARNSRGVDARADIYSLGCTAYYLLTHRVPFPAETAIEKLLMHCEQVPDPIERLRPDLPSGLVTVIRKLMSKKPEERFQSATEAAEALAAYVNYTPPPAPAVPTRASAPPISPASRHSPVSAHPPASRGQAGLRRTVALTVGVLIVLGVVGVRQWQHRNRPSIQNAPPAPVSPLAESRKSAGPRVLYLLGHRDAQWAEFEPVKRTLAERGYKVAVVAASREPIRFADKPEATGLQPDGLIGEVLSSEFDALVIGGSLGMEEFIGSGASAAGVRKLIGELMQTGKPIAALGMGTAVLSDSGVLRGKRVTCSPAAQEKVAKDGALVILEGVVTVDPALGHGPIVTARDSASALPFAQALLGKIPSR